MSVGTLTTTTAAECLAESDSKSEPVQLDHSHVKTAAQILAIIERYSLPKRHSEQDEPDQEVNFLDQIYAKVAEGKSIEMCLPAFPFKSPNTSTKVLGCLPDKAEEFALAHLNGMCAAIEDVYSPGASTLR